MKGVIVGKVPVPLGKNVAFPTMMTVPTDTLVVTVVPLITTGLGVNSVACVDSGELDDPEEEASLEREGDPPAEEETRKGAALSEGVADEDGLKTEVGNGLELTVLEDSEDVGGFVVVEVAVVVVVVEGATEVVCPADAVVVLPARFGIREGPFVLVEVIVRIENMETVVRTRFWPPALQLKPTALIKLVSAIFGKFITSVPVGLTTLTAVLRVIAVPELVKHVPSDENEEVTEYAENTSYAVGEVLNQSQIIYSK